MPVWQKAMETAEVIHKLTVELPRTEDYGFTAQIRRSALSISANIAEAYGRNHSPEKIHFYYIARGSVTETESHVEYGKRVSYFSPQSAEALEKQLDALYNDINKIILSLKTSRS